MPSLEDIPNLAPKTSPSGSDLIALHDVAEVGNSRIKKSTLLQALSSVVGALPGPYADDAAAASGGVALGALYLNDSFGPSFVATRVS